MSVVVESEPSVLLGRQRPGLLHLPPGTDEYAAIALELLGEWGFTLDAAQRFVIAGSLREMPDGRWAAKEVGFEEPRQNGKGETIEARECLGLFYFNERKLIHSAHEFATASEALDRMDDRISQNPQLKRLVRSVKRSHGEEGVYLKDGRSLRYKTRTKGGGRGFSADLLILDEAMYIAEAFLGALMPVISARPNPQMWYAGSAVNQNTMEHGVVFARLRQRALEGAAGRMAYFGWSAAYVDNQVVFGSPADVSREQAADPELCARANPALGRRIDPDHALVTEREAMSHEQYCVERLGIGDWPSTEQVDGGLFEPGAWARLADVSSSPSGPVCFAFSVNPDRTRAAIAAAGYRPDGLAHVEIVDARSGTDWVPERMAAVASAHQNVGVVVNGKGQAPALAPDIDGVEVTKASMSDVAQACARLADAVTYGRLRHLGDERLEAAVDGAGRRRIGEAWAWDHYTSSADITPLEAVTLALWGLDTTPPPSAPRLVSLDDV